MNQQSDDTRVSTSPPRQALSATILRFFMRNKWALSIAVIVICLFLGEAALRLLGMSQFAPKPISVSVEPGGMYFEPNEILGYTHLSGHFQVSIFGPSGEPDDKLVFKTTHDRYGLRITRPLDEESEREKGLWLFGGSFTHGWSVEDNETYAWLLQEKFVHLDVKNFGISGYGTLQSYLQLQRALKRSQPAVVVLAYASFHDQRNTFIRQRQKFVVPWNRLGNIHQPFAKLNADGDLEISNHLIAYSEFPLMRYSALIHQLEKAYNRFEARMARSHEVTKRIIELIAEECKQAGALLVLAGLNQDKQTVELIDHFRAEGISTVNISPAGRGMTNLPYDGHPSAKAHRQMAEQLADHLEQKHKGRISESDTKSK